MALKTLVKVGEITNLSDARYCAGMGVEMLGFNLNQGSDTYVSPEQFKEITEWVAGVKFVGEFANATIETIQKSIREYKLDMIQLPFVNADLIFEVDLPVILYGESCDTEEIDLLVDRLGDRITFFLLEGCEDIEQIEHISENQPILLGGNLEADNVDSWIEGTTIKGIALKGSLEEKPGFKDYDQLADILEALETDD